MSGDAAPDNRAEMPIGDTKPAGEAASAFAAPEIAMWPEILAVLAAGVFPQLTSATVYLVAPSAPMPYVVDALSLIATSTCAAYVALYLMHRSGTSWEEFGISRPRPYDAVFALILLGAAKTFYGVLAVILPVNDSDVFPVARSPLEYVLMVCKFGLSAFSEEVITRAYLITRLRQLFGSPRTAVIVAAFAFTVYHVYWGLLGTMYVFGIGLMYGVAFLLLRRIWPLVISHALFNILLELSDLIDL